MSSTNRGGERIEHDAYYTPDNLASVLVGTLDLAPGVTVWEPHAGGGAFVRALMQVRGAYIIVSDIDECAPALSAELGSEGAVEDFLCAARSPVDWVVGNPPFTEAEAHARHALSQATVGVAFLLRLAFLEGKGRIPFWREHPAARVYVLAERPSFTGGKTDSCAYGWFVWDKRHVGPTQLHTLSWSDAICADCFASVRVHDGAEWSNGDSLCDGCAGSRLARTERALTDLLAEVRGLTAERDNLPRLWWVRDDAEEGACCYDAPTAAEAVAKALPDFGYEPDDDADLTVLPVTELHVSGLQDEVRTLRARVAELEEAARWRMLPDPNPYLVPLASLGLDPDVLARVQAIANQRIPKGNNRSAGAVLCLLHGELFEAVAGKLGVRGG